MKKPILATIAITILSSGCASLNDSTLALGVDRRGDGIYSVKGTAFINPTEKAVEQCRIDGNKRLSVITSTFERGVISGKEHPVLIFRCE